jgi:lysophospholipase L1-like esterase
MAIALCITAAHCPVVEASVTPAQRSLRWLGGRQVWVPLCSRRGINGSAAWFDGINTTVMDQQACISPAWGTVTALKLVYAAFDMPQQGEIDRVGTATGTAAIFVPSLNSSTVTGGAGVSAGSLSLNSFSSTGVGASGISLGQSVSSPWGGIAAGTFVATVTNSFVSGSGNTPVSTVVTLSTGTSSATSNNQPFTFTGLFAPVKFGGRRNFLVEPGHDVMTSDPVAVQLAPSTWFMVRTSASMSAAGMQLMDLPVTSRLSITVGSASFQEFDSRGTSLNDQTLNPSSLSNSGGGYWGPVSLLAQVTPNVGQSSPGAVLILGDSIAAGTGDGPDSLGLEGYIQRSLENTVPFVSAARGSTTAFGLQAHGDGQYALSVDTGITDVLLELGRNDVEQFGIAASQLEATIKSLAGRYNAAGKRVWCFTVPPTTYSNDGWMTALNQSFPSAVSNTGTAATSSGATQVVMASSSGLIVGQSVGLNQPATGAIAPGSLVTAVNSSTNTITISNATTAMIAAGTKLYFGATTPGAAPLEVQRTTYNTFLRGNAASLGCAGLVDIDGVVADPSNVGKWRTDLGQASLDGVHPSAALHQAAVAAGLINAAMFSIP